MIIFIHNGNVEVFKFRSKLNPNGHGYIIIWYHMIYQILLTKSGLKWIMILQKMRAGSISVALPSLFPCSNWSVLQWRTHSTRVDAPKRDHRERSVGIHFHTAHVFSLQLFPVSQPWNISTFWLLGSCWSWLSQTNGLPPLRTPSVTSVWFWNTEGLCVWPFRRWPTIIKSFHSSPCLPRIKKDQIST